MAKGGETSTSLLGLYEAEYGSKSICSRSEESTQPWRGSDFIDNTQLVQQVEVRRQHGKARRQSDRGDRSWGRLW